MKSKIFTDYELKVLDQRFKGDKSDRTGVFSGRIIPKIKEMLEHWFPQKNKLKKFIEKKNGKN